MISILIALHVLGAVVWVGGMWVLHTAVRPAVGTLEPPQRLAVMHGALARFFPVVALAIAAILVSGYGAVFAVYGGFAGLPLHVNLMQATGWIMILLFGHLWFAPWRRMKDAVARQDWKAAGAAISQIRTIVTINLALGLVTVVLGASGRFWS
ncbi:MAG: CopD family protein [Alphaproteobacteria bacterium]